MMKRVVLMGAILLLFLPGNVLADGCQFVDFSSANVEVLATAQRAALWQRNGVWEIHIMPVFERAKTKAAWVVPFPVMPTVKESSSDFFNQLELLTAPMFIEACVNDSFNSACGPTTPGSDGNGASGGRGHVEIWDQGTVGELDYVVISADHQVYMVDWLKRNNYRVSSLAEASLKKFEAEGTFFFAAKISEGTDPTKAVTPVRFVLPDLKAPMYPLVLTGLGVPEGASLELSLWLITPRDSHLVPTSHRYGTLDQSIENLDDYTQALRRFYRTHKPGTLAMLYSGRLSSSQRIYKKVCVDGFCAPFSQLGIDSPESWCPEVNEIVSNNDWLFRYQGRLGPTSLSDDLAFGPLPEGGAAISTSNTYLYNTCAEEEQEEGCGSSN